MSDCEKCDGDDATRISDDLPVLCARCLRAEIGAIRQQLAAAPGWCDRPTGPGLWLLDAPPGSKLRRATVLELTQSDFDGGEITTCRVYGPIPADTGTK